MKIAYNIIVNYVIITVNYCNVCYCYFIDGISKEYDQG